MHNFRAVIFYGGPDFLAISCQLLAVSVQKNIFAFLCVFARGFFSHRVAELPSLA